MSTWCGALDLIFESGLEANKNVMPRKGELCLNACTQMITLILEAGLVAMRLPTAKRFMNLQYFKTVGVQ